MVSNPEHAPKTALQKKVHELQSRNSEGNDYTQEDFDRDFAMYGDPRGSISANPDETIVGLDRLLEASKRGMRATRVDVGDINYGTVYPTDIELPLMGHWHPVMNPMSRPSETPTDD